jgi:O-antigen/teichoic acid export membrane protein
MKQERNMLIYFLGKLVPAAAMLFIMIAGVRFLGKSEFGRYNLLFNCINIAIAFFVGWIQQSMLRFSPGGGEEQDSSRRQFTAYTFFSSLAASAAILFLSLFYFSESVTSSVLIASFVFTFGLLTVRLTTLQSQFRPGAYAATESAFYLTTILLLASIIYFSFPRKMVWFYFAWLVAGMGWMAVEAWSSRKLITGALRQKLDKAFFKKSFQYGFLITAWLLVSNLFNVVDRFIIRHFYDFEKVGVYSVVYDFIYRLTSFATLPVLLTLHPLIMKTWNENREGDAMSLVRKAVFLLSLLLVAELTGYYIFGGWIFERFFQIDSAGLMTLVIPLVISSVLWQAALFLHKPLELLFRQRQMIAGIVLSLLSNIVLNFIFVPLYGFYAAAYTTLASTLVYIAYATVAVKLIRKTIV